MKLLDDVTSKMRATIKRLATNGIIDKRERSEAMRGDVVRHDNQLLLLLLISCCPWRHPGRRRLTNSCSPRGPWRWRHHHPQHSHGYSNSEVREGIRVFGEPWYLARVALPWGGVRDRKLSRSSHLNSFRPVFSSASRVESSPRRGRIRLVLSPEGQWWWTWLRVKCGPCWWDSLFLSLSFFSSIILMSEARGEVEFKRNRPSCHIKAIILLESGRDSKCYEVLKGRNAV